MRQSKNKWLSLQHLFNIEVIIYKHLIYGAFWGLTLADDASERQGI